MSSNFRHRIHRKLNALRCALIRSRRTVFPPNRDVGYLTVFHDFESHYSLLTTKDISYRGVSVLLEIEKAFNVVATYAIVGKLVSEVPDLVASITSAGHELASHSFSHEVMTTLSKSQMTDDLRRTKAVFSSLGQELKGFRSPQSMWSFSLLDVLLKEGVRWTAERDTTKYPYVILEKNGKRLFRMPDTIDDWLYKARNTSPQQFYDILVNLVDSTAKEKTYASVGFHPWVQGEDEQRIVVFERFLQYVTQHPGIEIVTFGQMYKLCSGDKVNT